VGCRWPGFGSDGGIGRTTSAPLLLTVLDRETTCARRRTTLLLGHGGRVSRFEWRPGRAGFGRGGRAGRLAGPSRCSSHGRRCVLSRHGGRPEAVGTTVVPFAGIWCVRRLPGGRRRKVPT